MKRATILCQAALLAALLAACGPDAPDQADAGAAAESDDHGGVPEPDIVYGRQVLMSELLNLMLPIDRAAEGDPFDLDDARTRAEAISAILVAFPFMFPEGTGPEETRDNDWPSIALPTVWEEKEAFHEMSEEVAELAFDMVVIEDEARFRDMAAQLRQGCESCHASFMYDWRLEGELDPITGEPLPRD